MKIKLKPWDKVVEFAIQYDGEYVVYSDGIEVVFGMTANSLPWGKEIFATGPDEQGDFHVDGNYWVHDWMVDGYQPTTSDELLRYGKVLTDDVINGEDYIRIRLIAYNDDLWYHKMVDGEVVDFHKVGYPYD